MLGTLSVNSKFGVESLTGETKSLNRNLNVYLNKTTLLTHKKFKINCFLEGRSKRRTVILLILSKNYSVNTVKDRTIHYWRNKKKVYPSQLLISSIRLFRILVVTGPMSITRE